MNHQINIDEAIAIAKEYHLETEVTDSQQNQQCYLDLIIFIVTKLKKLITFQDIEDTSFLTKQQSISVSNRLYIETNC